jgi:small redox-active disulfide protein 2
MKIEVVGPGCFRCVQTEKNVNEALKQLDIAAEVSHIYDMRGIIKRGVMFTPALIVDGEIKTFGKIPTVDEIKKILSSDKLINKQ